MLPSGRGPRLRVKSGCQTCRTRKKKCDEGRPVCQRCLSIGWSCEWPTSAELVDRRRVAVQHPQSSAVVRDDHKTEERRVLDAARICLMSVSTAHEALSRDLKPLISKHFVDNYYGLILLPNCHPGYFWSFLNELQRLVPQCRSLQYTVLANAASHLHSVYKSAQMQELALTYYSEALRSLQALLGTTSNLDNNNALLISVMLLYTLGSTSQGTYSDIPDHVNAAVKIVTLRYFNTPAAISRTFDKLVLESVLFSMFLVSIGLWSDEYNPDNTFDLAFWLRAEQWLNQINIFPTPSPGTNSPVIGVPVALLKLLLLVRQLRHDLLIADVHMLRDLKREVSSWERSILCAPSLEGSADDELEDPHSQITQDSSSLYVISASILTEQILAGDSNTTAPSAHDPDCWKLRRAVSILRKYQDNEMWSRFFTSSVPVYTIGFFMTRNEDINLVRQDLQRRWDFTRFGFILRLCSDLEATWARRGHES